MISGDETLLLNNLINKILNFVEQDSFCSVHKRLLAQQMYRFCAILSENNLYW